jgi:hypothetical protein
MLIMLVKIPIHRLFLIGLIVFIFIFPVVITRTQSPFTSSSQDLGLTPISETLNHVVAGDWISSFPLLRYLVLFLLPVGILWIFIREKDEKVWPFVTVITIIILSGLIIIFSMLGISALPLPGLPQWELHMGIIYNLLLLFSGILIGDLLTYLLTILKENKQKFKLDLNRKFIVGLTIFFILVPFIYYGGINEEKYLAGQVGYFDAMTNDDLALIQWMQENIPNNSTVLVHMFDGGVYLAPLAGYKTLFVPLITLSNANPDYRKILDSIASGELTPEIYEKLQKYGFEYLFIGSKISPHGADLNWPHWNAEAVHGNPNFKLIHSVGSSYLFGINISDTYSNTLFKEDFQANSLQFWDIVERGDGEGDANIISYNGSSALEIKSRMSILSAFFSIYLNRLITLPTPDVTLNFKVDFETGSPAIYIYNDVWKERIEIPIRYSGEYSIDIGKLWRNSYGSPLPERLIIQLINRGDIGVENTVTFDYISIRTQGV